MEFPERISDRITHSIEKTLPDLSKQQLEIIHYGLSAFITNVYKIIFMFILSYFLGIFIYMLFAFFSYGFLRTFANGVHAKTELICFLTTNPIMFGIVYFSIYLNFSLYFKIIIFAIAFLIVFKYAPNDTKERPLVSRRLRKRLKILSCLALLVMCAFSLNYNTTVFSNIVALAALVESLMLTPIIYKLFKCEFQVGLKMNK